ncbi:MAG: PD-(D/E)XK nuclease family protein [Nanoarchaeota archaeon]
MVIYSHSRLSTYEQCPMKFKFKYLDKIPVEIEDTIECFMGRKVHEALEWFYKKIIIGEVPKLKDVLEQYECSWFKDFNKEIKIVKKEFSSEDYFIKGHYFISKYYEKNYPFENNILAIEKKILVDLNGKGEYLLRGFIDRLDYNKETKEYEIHDYKTGGWMKSQKELDKDRQLALYSLGIKQEFSDAERILLNWHFLAFNKKMFSLRTNEELEKLKQKTIELIKKIEIETNWPTSKSALCDWCEFQEHCGKVQSLNLDNLSSKEDI